MPIHVEGEAPEVLCMEEVLEHSPNSWPDVIMKCMPWETVMMGEAQLTKSRMIWEMEVPEAVVKREFFLEYGRELVERLNIPLSKDARAYPDEEWQEYLAANTAKFQYDLSFLPAPPEKDSVRIPAEEMAHSNTISHQGQITEEMSQPGMITYHQTEIQKSFKPVSLLPPSRIKSINFSTVIFRNLPSQESNE